MSATARLEARRGRPGRGSAAAGGVWQRLPGRAAQAGHPARPRGCWRWSASSGRSRSRACSRSRAAARPTRCSACGCTRRGSPSRSSCSGSAGQWGLPRDGRRAGRRHVRLRGPLRDVEDRADPVVHPPEPVRRQGARGGDVRDRAAGAAGGLEPRAPALLLVGDAAAGQPERHARCRPGTASVLVCVAWLLSVLPMLAFVSLAVLFSVATRNGIVGVLGPGAGRPGHAAAALVGTGVWLHSCWSPRRSTGGTRCSPRTVLRAAGDRRGGQRDLDRGLPGRLVAAPAPARLRRRRRQPPPGLGRAGAGGGRRRRR